DRAEIRMDRFGATLKQARETRKLSLEDVALATKIGVRFLKALEDEDFAKLPGGMFNKSFTRAYARELGLNEEEAVAGYLKASGGQTAPARNPQSSPGRRIGSASLGIYFDRFSGGGDCAGGMGIAQPRASANRAGAQDE